MGNKSKILLYPYSRSMRPLVVYQELLGKDMEIGSVVSPGGWGLAGDELESFGKKYVVQTDFERELMGCDSIWFCEDGEYELPENLLRNKVVEALKSGKKIIYARKERFDDINLNSYTAKETNYKKRLDWMFMNELLPVDVPVITVLGNFQNVDQMEIQLALRYEFMKRGYRVSSITLGKSALPMNIHPIPEYIINGMAEEKDKILSFNHYLKVLVSEENPDVIVLGIPGWIYPYEDKFFRESGNGIYEFSAAAKSDFSIFCSVYGEWIQEELHEEIEMLKNRYQLNIDIIHMSPYYWSRDGQLGGDDDGSTIELNESFLYEKIPELDQANVWNLRKYENIQKITDRIIEILS